MRLLVTILDKVGQFLTTLSDKTRLRAVVLGLLLLGGPAVYKLVVNLQNLTKPIPAAAPDALIKPMEQLIHQTSSQAADYQKARHQTQQQLDSLKFYYQPKTN